MRVRGSVFPEEKEGMEYLSREWKSDWTLTYGSIKVLKLK